MYQHGYRLEDAKIERKCRCSTLRILLINTDYDYSVRH